MAARNFSSRVTRNWNPSRYLAFESQRIRPALDLLRGVQYRLPDGERVRRLVDLGCGTGNATPHLWEAYPDASVLCVDSSPTMLERARDHHSQLEGDDTARRIDYRRADFESLDEDEEGELADLIFSNAALHWVGFDLHRKLLPEFMGLLRSGGVLALQMPDTREQASHVSMVEAMEALGYAESVRWVTTEEDPAAYHELLKPHCDELDLWSTEYVHALEGDNPVADFTASTGLGPYVEALGGSGTERARAFVQKYRDLVARAYPKQSDGTTLFGMNRFFLVARKR